MVDEQQYLLTKLVRLSLSDSFPLPCLLSIPRPARRARALRIALKVDIVLFRSVRSRPLALPDPVPFRSPSPSTSVPSRPVSVPFPARASPLHFLILFRFGPLPVPLRSVPFPLLSVFLRYISLRSVSFHFHFSRSLHRPDPTEKLHVHRPISHRDLLPRRAAATSARRTWPSKQRRGQNTAHHGGGEIGAASGRVGRRRRRVVRGEVLERGHSTRVAAGRVSLQQHRPGAKVRPDVEANVLHNCVGFPQAVQPCLL